MKPNGVDQNMKWSTAFEIADCTLVYLPFSFQSRFRLLSRFLTFCCLWCGMLSTNAQQDFGSGFIIHSDGYVLTQKRAGQGGGKIEIVLADGSRHIAKTVASDAQAPFSLLKIQAEGLPVVPLGDSGEIDVMDSILTIGFPQAPDSDISAYEGKINARRTSPTTPLFQIDLTLDPGHCGSPIINEFGEAVGMVIPRSDASRLLPNITSLPERMNYAIPMETLMSQVNKLIPQSLTTTYQQERLAPKQIFRNLKPAVVKVCNYSAPVKTARNSSKTLQIPLPNLPAGTKPLEMVLIPSGSFQMGNPAENKNRESNENPVTPVSLTKSFYIGKFEVTQAQWVTLMEFNPSHHQDSLDLPVERVSWYDATEYCRKLNELLENMQAIPEIGEALEFRLPTEAEWEYACRATTSAPYYFGLTLKTNQANFDGRSSIDAEPSTEDAQESVSILTDADEYYLEKTTPVGQFPPNTWGIFDMHGNVQEWCLDRYRSRLPGEKVTNPKGPTIGIYRVCRGGSWFDRPHNCRSSSRNPMPPSAQLDNIGFRVVLSAK